METFVFWILAIGAVASARERHFALDVDREGIVL